jgi:hypothetical protein
MTLILGVVIGRETAALDQRVFPHLCAKHRRFFAMASNESRQRIEASAEIERLERETHPNLN